MAVSVVERSDCLPLQIQQQCMLQMQAKGTPGQSLQSKQRTGRNSASVWDLSSAQCRWASKMSRTAGGKTRGVWSVATSRARIGVTGIMIEIELDTEVMVSTISKEKFKGNYFLQSTTALGSKALEFLLWHKAHQGEVYSNCEARQLGGGEHSAIVL